ncbi:hypothetical protein [[Limnothrix rosea] IAM M-220]|uniref:hypothetical protein n=1 Tax=[Limnothrix rosea] IAM M-220 TaxID=454133 RepID=UPI000967A777|nr:hypothetical protein [[Limnothrix rosea] IAM M-220]OKH12689.1 hypothetical protein NIES208_15820 [[Limnothrix rosea] IAM M-220]
MGIASKLILINIALANFLLPSNAVAASLSGYTAISGSDKQIAISEIAFEPANGGECRGDDKCAAGGAY